MSDERSWTMPRRAQVKERPHAENGYFWVVIDETGQRHNLRNMQIRNREDVGIWGLLSYESSTRMGLWYLTGVRDWPVMLCPACGCSTIYRIDSVYVSSEVLSWDPDSDDTNTLDEGDGDVSWDSTEFAFWECGDHRCHWDSENGEGALIRLDEPDIVAADPTG